MMFTHKKRKVPELNTTSTADISFMLLILFLVTTSMDVDKGLSRQLPPPTPPKQENVQTNVDGRNVLKLKLAADDRLTVNDKSADIRQLRSRVMAFVDNSKNLPDMPERICKNIPGLGKCYVTDRHIIQITVDRNASYDAYFQLQNEVVAAYNTLRDGLAMRSFHHAYAFCSDKEKDAVKAYYPQRISEVYDAGGQK